MARVGIFGAGWVGLVTGACFAELGHEVVVRDVVPEKIEALQRGEVPFHEADVPELLAAEPRAPDLHARLGRPRRLPVPLRLRRHAADARRATPTSRASGASSTSCPSCPGAPILVMKSTVPVGTGEKIRHGLDERGLDDIGYVSNPEFLAEGTRGARLHASRTGSRSARSSRADGDAVAELYARLDAPIVRCDVNSAEMIKLAANAVR